MRTMETQVSVAPAEEDQPDLAAPTHWPVHLQVIDGDVRQDHFVTRDGETFAGTHLLFDLWGASRLDDLGNMEFALRRAVEACGATLLHIHLHHFTPNGGISGVAVLAESHISVHTWPERGYAAFDVFMCGGAQPEKALDVFRQCFSPARVLVKEHRRGLVGE